jgi:hypothetical protein
MPGPSSGVVCWLRHDQRRGSEIFLGRRHDTAYVPNRRPIQCYCQCHLSIAHYERRGTNADRRLTILRASPRLPSPERICDAESLLETLSRREDLEGSFCSEQKTKRF